ncbi:MAG TPA: VOC family protein [Gemmatimonadaceae bacterium]|nr:VOC family protein [Gemmatimonadaceae bacterium]
MDEPLTELFDEFDRGVLSRRQLLQALGLAAVGSAVPMSLFSQGRCGGQAGAAGCDTIPAKAPFDSTGWRTVSLDHFTMAAADYKKEVAYYAALMNWKVLSDDGTKAVLGMGDVGKVVIRGGYQAPPPPPRPAPAAGDSAAGRGRGGRGGGGQRAPRNAVWDSFCWGIEPWNTGKVEEELKKRGLNPVRGNDGPGSSEYFMITDPGGFTLKISDAAKVHGGSGIKLSEPAPFENTNWKTVWLDHISFQCPNYKESAAFYQALLGWKPTGDEGSQNETEIGDLGNIIIRGGGGARGAAAGRPPGQGNATKASIDHIAFGITPWDTDAVAAELTKRGLSARPDTGGKGDIHDEKALYKSYHTTTPNGFDLQISNANKANRTVR